MSIQTEGQAEPFPYNQDGFVRVLLEDVRRQQFNRYDNSLQNGPLAPDHFGQTVAFRRSNSSNSLVLSKKK